MSFSAYLPTMQKWFLFFLFIGFVPALPAQQFAGKYTGAYQGDPVVLQLRAAGANAYTGELNDNHNNYSISATAEGNRLKGQCTETTIGLAMALDGSLADNRLSLSLTFGATVLTLELEKEAVAVPAKTTAASGKEQHDPALVGRWTRQSNYNSGYGQGYMSTESAIVLFADGRVADGGSRTVTSGADWSGNASSAGSGVVEGLYWYSDKQQIFLRASQNGKTETQALGRYYIENGNMLITGQDGTKTLWSRN